MGIAGRRHRAACGPPPTSSRSSASTSPLKRVGRRWVRASARSTARSRRRSRSTPRRGSTTASAAARRATSSPSCARSSTSTSSVPSRSWPAKARHHAALHRRGRERGPQAAQPSCSRRWTKAVEWYHERLLVGARRGARPGATCARGASTGDEVRGLPGRLGARRLGRAGPGPQAARRRASSTPGLGFLNSRGRPTDCFRGRVLFPIFDVSGDPVGFGGRIMPGSEGPKYKNSAESSHLQQEQGALRAQLGQGRHRDGRRGHRLRGLHRRHRVRQGRRAPGGGHLRHRAHRGARQGCSGASPGGSCWPSTPTRPARTRPSGSTSGSASTTSTWPWPPCPRASTRPTWPESDPGALRRRGRAGPCRSSGSGSTGCSARRHSTPPKGGPAPPRPPWPSIAEHPTDLVRDQYLMEVAARCRVDANQLRNRRFAAPAAARAPRASVVATTSRPPGRAPCVPTAPRPPGDPARHVRDRGAASAASGAGTRSAAWLDETALPRPVALDRVPRAWPHARRWPTRRRPRSRRPGPADLLQRLAVEETEAEPHDVVDPPGRRGRHDLRWRRSRRRPGWPTDPLRRRPRRSPG